MSENNNPFTALVPMAYAPDVTKFSAVTASAATGVTQAFTLPTIAGSQNGVYDFVLTAKVPDGNNMGVVRGTIIYVRGSANILATVAITSQYTTSSTHGVNGLSLGNPNASGVVTAAVSWTDSSSQVVTLELTLIRISEI